MPLTQAQRISVSRDMVIIPSEVEAADNAKLQLEDVKTGLQQRDDNIEIFFDDYNLQADSYFLEHRWINGNTYTNLPESDLIDAAQRLPGNIFFPSGWMNFQPVADDKTKGIPTSNSTLHELEILNRTFAEFGLLELIDFLLNGQASGVSDTTTLEAYSGGIETIDVAATGQTVGKYVMLDDGTNSSLVKITATYPGDPSAGFCSNPLYTDQTSCLLNGGVWTPTPIPANITVEPYISNSVSSGAIVRENIFGWPNSERETLIATFGDYVLEQLGNLINQAVLDWETPVLNSSAAINSNTNPEVSSAKLDTDNTKTIIDNWQTKATSGIDGRLVNTNINTLSSEAADRITYIGTRSPQITTALGTLSQNLDGTYSGTGVFLDRFHQINSRINLIGGPLTEYYEKNLSTTALQIRSDILENILVTFETELETAAFDANADGTNIIKVEDSSGFSVSDSVYVMADNETELSGSILGINGNFIILDFNVSINYTKAKHARLYKQL